MYARGLGQVTLKYNFKVIMHADKFLKAPPAWLRHLLGNYYNADIVRDLL